LNYYFDNGNPPGQTFTTGTNASGYNLTNVAILMNGGNGADTLPVGGQGYFLRIYSVNTNTTNATLFATYESQTNFIITQNVNDTDWVGFSGFSAPLLPNSTYAWTFGRDHSQSYDNGWVELASDNANPYAGGQSVVIPPAGGPMQLDTAGGIYDAVFDLGFSLGVGTVTLSAQVVTGGKLQLQWSSGILQQASSLGGPWTANATATSPCTVFLTGPQMFYRIKVQ